MKISFTDGKADIHTKQGNPVSVSLSPRCCAGSSAGWLPHLRAFLAAPKTGAHGRWVVSEKQAQRYQESLRPKHVDNTGTAHNSEGVKLSAV